MALCGGFSNVQLHTYIYIYTQGRWCMCTCMYFVACEHHVLASSGTRIPLGFNAMLILDSVHK